MSSKRHSQNNRESQNYPTQSEAPTINNRYLRPEDAYNMDSDGGYFGTSTSSHTSSRHGSDSYSPSHSNLTSAGYSQTTYTQASDPFQQYQYAGTSQNVSSTGSPYSSRRLTPIDDYSTQSRHSPQSGTYKQTSPSFDRDNAQRSSGASLKDKGKQKQCDNQGSSRTQGEGSRHGSGDSRGGRRHGGTVSEKLVHGVFIRY